MKIYPLIAAGAAAALVVILCSPALDGQGMYYDEAQQAPAAFVHVGKSPSLSTPLLWRTVPLLTMTYSGAVKSNLFGVWMKWTGVKFTVISWRLFGIGLVAIGLFLFCLLAGATLEPFGLAVFLFFFLTDVAVLLTSRHDWGPTAVALMLRLFWLGIWVNEQSRDAPRTMSLLLLGFIPAFSIYDKLNNAVLMGPLVLAVLLWGHRRRMKRAMLVSAGFLLGLIPLAVVNALTNGISFRAFQDTTARTPGALRPEEIVSFLNGALSLGDGHLISTYILGVPAIDWVRIVELSFLIVFGAVAAAVSITSWRLDGRARLAGISLLSYVSVIALIFALFLRASSAHHWIVGTPFQYVAIAMAAAVIRKNLRQWRSDRAAVAMRVAFVVFVVFVVYRGYNVAAMERHLAARLSSPPWDPSYTTVATFAAEHRADANFVLADWGFATQIYSLSNGTSPVVEPFWNWGNQWGPNALSEYVTLNRGRPIYVLSRTQEPAVFPAATADIIKTVELFAGGQQLPLEESLRNLRSVRVVKFIPLDRSALDECSGPPAAPDDLRVATNSDRVVTLTWNGPRASETRYIVEAGHSPGSVDVLQSNLGGWQTTFRATGVVPSTYYARVRGRNTCGTSAPSNEIIVVVR